MYLLVLGLVLFALKTAGLGPVADWPWWGVLLPFPLVALWWTVSDLTGLTRKRATEREQARRVDRMRKLITRNTGRKPAR